MNYFFLFLLTITTSAITGYSQSWYKLAGLSPNIPLKQVEAAQNGSIIVGTSDNYLFYSNNDGISWSPFLAPPWLSYTNNMTALHYNESTQTLFVGTSISGISYASNYGASWSQEFFSTQPASGIHESIGSIGSLGNLVVLAGNYALTGEQRYFYSTNNGLSWSSPVQGFGAAEDILIDEDTSWVIATNLGLMKTSDSGSSWNTLAFISEKVRAVEKNSTGEYFTVVQTGTSNTFRVYSSTDLNSWTLLHTFTNTQFNELIFSPSLNSLLLGTNDGLFQYSLSSSSYTLLEDAIVIDLAENSSNILMYASPSEAGLRIGTSPNINWQNSTEGMSAVFSYQGDQFIISDSVINTTTSSTRLLGYFPILDSSQWNYSFVDDPSEPIGSFNQFLQADSNGTIYAGSPYNIYKLQGQSWSSITYPSIIPSSGGNYSFYYFNIDINNNLYLAQQNDNGSIWTSADEGFSWQVLLDQSDLTNLSIASVIKYQDVVMNSAGDIFVALTTISLANKLITSTDGGQSWTDISPPFASSFSGDFTIIPCPNGELLFIDQKRIYSLTNNGPLAAPWDPNNTDILNLYEVVDNSGALYINVSGTVFCNECGVYKMSNSAWEYYGYPSILAGYTPSVGIELVGDTIPVVQTSYNFTEGSISSMGYYYYSFNPLPIGLNELSDPLNLILFPNPTSEYFSIESKEQTVGLEMNDLQGRLVLTRSVENGEKISISDLPKGTYIVKVTYSQGEIFKKLLIR